MKHSASIIVTLFAAVAAANGGTTPPTEATLPESKVTPHIVLDSLTVREKVGQLIMPWLIGSYAPLEGDAFDNAAKWIDDFGVGGIIISIGSPLDAAAKLNALQRRSKLPLIIAADLEYGAAMRMIGATAFPPPMAFGATGRELDAYQLGRITAIEARAVGIHWTFSPVADINSNPDNPTHQYPIVRGVTGANRSSADGLHPRRVRPRVVYHGQAFPRPWRHGNRLPHLTPGAGRLLGAAGYVGAGAVPGGHQRRG